MQFSTTKALPSSINSDCLVVGVHEKAQLTRAAAQLDKACGGLIRALVKAGDMDGKVRSTRLLFNPPGIAAKRVLLRARKGARGPARVWPGLVLHETDGRFTAEAQAILRDAAPLCPA